MPARTHTTLGLSLISALAIAVLQFACSVVENATPTSDPGAPEVEPATPVALTSQPTQLVPSEAQAATDEAPSLPDLPLSEAGPWYVFTAFGAVHELWALNGDGSGLTLLTSDLDQTAGAVSARYSLWPAPQGGRVAIVQVDDAFAQSVPMLKLLELPSGDVRTVTPLLETADGYRGLDLDAQTQVWAAVGVSNRPAWSPDGRWLAFNAAIDGPSADVYVYDTSTDRIERLTDGPDQSVDLAWSPDSAYIVHGVADSLYYGYSGLGYGMVSAWAAPPDPDKPVLHLYDHVFHGYEYILGWLGDRRYLGDSLDGDSLGNCGYSGLRTIDIPKGPGPNLLAGSYSLRAFDVESGQMLLVLSPTLGEFDCPTSLDPGVYLFDINSRKAVRVPDVDPQPIMSATWSPQIGRFFLGGGSELVTVDLNGRVTSYPSPEDLWESQPVFGPGGQAWALEHGSLSGGVAVGTQAGELFEIGTEGAASPFWSLDGEWLLFFTGVGVYAVPSPDFAPAVSVRGMLSPDTPVLVNP